MASFCIYLVMGMVSLSYYCYNTQSKAAVENLPQKQRNSTFKTFVGQICDVGPEMFKVHLFQGEKVSYISKIE